MKPLSLHEVMHGMAVEIELNEKGDFYEVYEGPTSEFVGLVKASLAITDEVTFIREVQKLVIRHHRKDEKHRVLTFLERKLSLTKLMQTYKGKEI